MSKNSIWEVAFKSLTVVGLVTVIYLQTRSDDSIVYVDAIKLVNGYTGMKEARKAYEAKTATWKSNLDSLTAEFEGRVKNYQQRQSLLSAKEKQLTEELLKSKEEQLLNYRQVISEKVQKEDQELSAQVLAKVNDYIKRFGEAEGYQIIMAATQYGNIVYSEKGKDITERVLDGLNREYAN